VSRRVDEQRSTSPKKSTFERHAIQSGREGCCVLTEGGGRLSIVGEACRLDGPPSGVYTGDDAAREAAAAAAFISSSPQQLLLLVYTPQASDAVQGVADHLQAPTDRPRVKLALQLVHLLQDGQQLSPLGAGVAIFNRGCEFFSGSAQGRLQMVTRLAGAATDLVNLDERKLRPCHETRVEPQRVDVARRERARFRRCPRAHHNPPLSVAELTGSLLGCVA
jgi:hypothetical protein